MGKDVVVIASGETERRSLPHLLLRLRAEDISVIEVRIPPGGRALTVEMAEKLVKASWYVRINAPPDKFVVLLDTDGKAPNEVLRPFREQLPVRISSKISAQFQFAYAQQHLEAWYFADHQALRAYLERDLGSVDVSKPDEIQNPQASSEASAWGARLYRGDFRRNRTKPRCGDHRPAKSEFSRIR